MLIGSLQALFTGATIEYVSKEQAFQTLKSRNPDLAMLVEHTDENPLPNSLMISHIHNLTDYQELPKIMERYQDVLQYDKSWLDKKIIDFETQYKSASKVVYILQIFQYGILILLWLFIFTVFAIVHMIIRNFIYFLQDEVRIIELVGWSPYFIYGPFVIQWWVYTGFSAFLALTILFLGYQFITVDFITGPIKEVVSEFFLQFPFWIYVQVCGFSLLWIFSSLIASRSYIHSTIAD
jgi:cell division protein FtsX